MKEDYQRIARAIEFIRENYLQQPTLDQVAAAVHVSPFHLQRVFRRWAGISPKRFLQYLTARHAAQLLREPMPLLEAALESGLSGPGRLHDLFVQVDAVTPGEFKEMGSGLNIEFGLAACPFGEALLAVTPRGLCHLAFVEPGEREDQEERLRQRWPNADFSRCDEVAAEWSRRIFESVDDSSEAPFPLLLKGTNFQIKVWEALLQIPRGAVTTYQQVAESVRNPAAVRAVSSAIASNPITYLIPCHRVIRKGGELGGYSGGPVRKQALLAWESSRLDQTQPIGA